MAKGFEATKAVNMIAGESLAGDVYEALTVENDGGVGKVIKASAATDVIIGILAESVDATSGADGETVPVVLMQGVVWMKAAGNITAGEVIVPSTTAGAVSSVANPGALAVDQMGVGVALESAVAGDIFPVLAQTIAAPHTA